jgi:hypothetical protein
MILIQIILEIHIWQLIATLILSIVRGMFLNSVISQMNKLVRQIVDTKFARRCTQIPFIIKVTFHIAVYARHQTIWTNVELTSVYKQRVWNVLLHYACTLLGMGGLLDNFCYFSVVVADWDALAPISIFTWFYNPNIWLFPCCTLKLLCESNELLVIKTWLNMECDWQSMEWILTYCFIEEPHVKKQCFFVWKMIIVF